MLDRCVLICRFVECRYHLVSSLSQLFDVEFYHGVVGLSYDVGGDSGFEPIDQLVRGVSGG